MVPAYETSVSPQASRTHMKAETSEDERKILLVPFRLLFVLLCEGNEVCLSCMMQQEYLAAFKGSWLSPLTWTSPPGGAGMKNIGAALDASVFPEINHSFICCLHKGVHSFNLRNCVMPCGLGIWWLLVG